jgi:hypothetical protein
LFDQRHSRAASGADGSGELLEENSRVDIEKEAGSSQKVNAGFPKSICSNALGAAG